jgi:hypothetical protein
MLKSSTLALCLMGAVLCTAVALADDSKPAAPTTPASTPSSCVHDTGTRIKSATNGCSISPGHSYSKEELDRTGRTTAAGALRNLDPSLTIH